MIFKSFNIFPTRPKRLLSICISINLTAKLRVYASDHQEKKEESDLVSELLFKFFDDIGSLIRLIILLLEIPQK